MFALFDEQKKTRSKGLFSQDYIIDETYMYDIEQERLYTELQSISKRKILIGMHRKTHRMKQNE